MIMQNVLVLLISMHLKDQINKKIKSKMKQIKHELLDASK